VLLLHARMWGWVTYFKFYDGINILLGTMLTVDTNYKKKEISQNEFIADIVKLIVCMYRYSRI